MNEELNKIRKLIDDWYSFRLTTTVADIMPHLIYMVELYDNLYLQIQNLSSPFESE